MFQQLRSLLGLFTQRSPKSINLSKQKKYFEQLFSKYSAHPEVLFSNEKADIAVLYGREMQLQRLKKHHDLVVEMGRLAGKLKLSHERIATNYKKSLQASVRQKNLNELEQLRISENVSKKDYEKAIIKAWIEDPDCSEYLELLKKVISKRLRQDPLYSSASKELKGELVDFQINRRILIELADFNQWKPAKSQSTEC